MLMSFQRLDKKVYEILPNAAFFEQSGGLT